ncbi:ABC transporter permease [Desulfitobacterium metallireducens]|uniref:ABC transporter permease n=1 Tax=Desulfitobacterium metallireducens DSM 15288 TaxID=871968 RepID=W0E5E2_9FIRM|nr:FtsX-like permease family protein [Desulfitobacterium metallireducens]AHF05977.1 ABC transporter permease [Desulfitobacterium metallireducens DSM 15288]
MRLVHISVQNLRRRKSRALLMMLSIVIGIASSTFLFTTTQAMEKDVADKLDQYGSNLLILPDSGEALTFGGITVGVTRKPQDLDMTIIEKMKTIENKESLATISPKLLADVEIQDQKVLLVGVDFAQELRLKKWWKIEGLNFGELPEKNEIIVGSEVARILGLNCGENVDIKGQPFLIKGVIQPTGSVEDDQAIFINLQTLQGMVNKPNSLSMVEAAALCYTCPIDQITQQLSEKLPGTQVTALWATLESRDQTVNKFSIFSIASSLILLITSALVVAISMISSVRERTRDIGVLGAIGFRKRHILQIIFLEAALVSLIGGLAGYFLGMGLAEAYGPTVAEMAILIPWQPILGVYATFGAVMISVLASIYPAWKAAKLDPIEALRYF